MKIHFSNQGMLRNFENFLESADLSKPSELHISTNPKWINVHPAILVMTAALARKAGRLNST